MRETVYATPHKNVLVRYSILFTPRFSAVISNLLRIRKPFKRFPPKNPLITGLKPGVNEMSQYRISTICGSSLTKSRQPRYGGDLLNE